MLVSPLFVPYSSLLAATLLLMLSVGRSSSSCQCGLRNMTVVQQGSGLTAWWTSHRYCNDTADSSADRSQKDNSDLMWWTAVNVTRCWGSCDEPDSKGGGDKLACKPSVTEVKYVDMLVPWSLPIDDLDGRSSMKPALTVTMSLEEHLDCQCVDATSISIRDDEVVSGDRLVRRSVSPSSAPTNAVITTRATWRNRAHHSTVRTRTDVPITPTEHEILYYKTCLACKEQQDICQVNGQVYDADVCHCVYPASRTFLNSFYTLGVVMLTVMVCCFLVFGVQKGDENVLNSSRRSTRRSTSRRCSGSYRESRYSYRDRDDVERSECPNENARSTNCTAAAITATAVAAAAAATTAPTATSLAQTAGSGSGATASNNTGAVGSSNNSQVSPAIVTVTATANNASAISTIEHT